MNIKNTAKAQLFATIATELAQHTFIKICQNQFYPNEYYTIRIPGNGDLYGESVSISRGQYIVGSAHAVINWLVNARNIYFGDE